jgi:EAL domain-containing protein (putative c-di-GMP-specific phosphodiesterase class I)
MKAHFSQSLDIENGLRKAISTDELRLHYQPQFDIINGKMVGVEALVRWQHPQRGQTKHQPEKTFENRSEM